MPTPTLTAVVPDVGTYQQPRTQQYQQLQATNNPNASNPFATPGQVPGSDYNYQSAIQDRLKSIGQLGTNANAIQQRQLHPGGIGSAGPANYNIGGAFKGDLSQSNTLRSKIVNQSEKFRGMWYHWGGANPNTSFDCSGLVQYVFGRFGIHLPRVASSQAMVGRVTAINNLKPGDLVAWDHNRDHGADHIAIYVGGGMVMEAAHTGSQLRVRRLGSNEGAWGVSLSQYLG